ncbi:MAG: hypothetical protein ACRD3W_11325, partial [Terriglobales bacterium]
MLFLAPRSPGDFVAHLPITLQLDQIASAIMTLACIGGVIGFRTRTCAFLVFLLGIYVLGIPQCYGKVNHCTQHLIWFAGVLALSRCADVLSIDALIKSRREADRGITRTPAPSMIYGLPLRLIWLMMGTIYFFPGFWKLKTSGIAWAFSDNLVHYMYQSWVFAVGGWQPFFRIDRYPALCQSAAFGTLIFELSFVALIFSPLGRIVLVVLGQLFHTMTQLFMHIAFFELQACYVALVNWNAILHSFGKLLFPRRLMLTYDVGSSACRRVITFLGTMDVLDRIAYLPVGTDSTQTDGAAADDVTTSLLSDDGFYDSDVVLAVAKRVPTLWPLLPVLQFKPLRKMFCATILRRMFQNRANSDAADATSIQ